MSFSEQELHKMIRLYREETGVSDVNMPLVAAWAAQRGYVMPAAPTPIEILAKKLSKAARTETRTDLKTGLPYRVNHAYPEVRNGETLTFWVDIDNRAASRDKMDKSLKIRREQMVGDGVQLTLDANHWNSVNPDSEPLQVELDFTDDVAWRLNAPANTVEERRQAS